MLTGVNRSTLLRGGLATPVAARVRRFVVMAEGKKSVLVPIGNGSEEMEAVISELLQGDGDTPWGPHQQNPGVFRSCTALRFEQFINTSMITAPIHSLETMPPELLQLGMLMLNFLLASAVHMCCLVAAIDVLRRAGAAVTVASVEPELTVTCMLHASSDCALIKALSLKQQTHACCLLMTTRNSVTRRNDDFDVCPEPYPAFQASLFVS